MMHRASHEDLPVLTIIGSRGSSSNYGGFETLVKILKARVVGPRIEISEMSTPHPERSKLNYLTGKYLETVLTGIKMSFSVPNTGNSVVLILNPINVIAALILTKRRIFVVIHMDGRDDLRKKWSPPIRILINFFQKLCLWSRIPLIFDSVAVRSEVGGRNFWEHELIAYGGCESCERRRRTWKMNVNSRSFLTLARAEPENQLLEVVRAFGVLKTLKRLRVVSTARYKGKYWKALVEEVSRNSSVELVDGIWDKEQLCLMYREVSAVVHGHTVGGTNPSLVLALCHGTPVLAHDNPYNREVAGSLARYWKNEEELTRLLDEFDPASWPYDQAAVDDFNRRYNWDDVVEKYRLVLGLSGPTGTATTN